MKRLFALAALVFVGAAGSDRIVLREQGWTVALGDRDPAYAMTHAPSECAAATDLKADAGRALFRSPTLLGGPAARAGLSCHACHTNGRANAHFLLPELTDRAGAVDVTSEWSSRVRGDGIMNPVDIPDLTDVARQQVFGQTRERSLERFVHGVIVEEFQGPAPNDRAMDLMLHYLQSLRSEQCETGMQRVTLAAAADDVRRALAGTQVADDWATTSLLLAAAQEAVGRIVERLPSETFSADRARLQNLARELGAMRSRETVALEDWRPRFDAAIARIAPHEPQTYFNESTLRARLDP